MDQPTRGPVRPRAASKQGVTLEVRSYDVFGKTADGRRQTAQGQITHLS